MSDKFVNSSVCLRVNPEGEPVLRKFGLALKRQREAKGLTQEALGEKADLDRTYLSDVERGTRNLGLKNIVRLAKALEITTAELCKEVDR